MVNLDNRLIDKLTGEEIGLFVHIIKRIGIKKTAWPSRKLLQKETGYGRGKLAKCLKSLIDKKIISSKQMNKGGAFGNVVYTIETKHAGVYISVQGHELEEDYRNTETRNTENRTTETRTQSIIHSKVLKKDGSIDKIKLHSPSSSNSQQPTLKRTKFKTSKTKETIPTKPTLKERNEQILPIAEKLAEIIKTKKNIKTPKTRLNQWCNDIRKLHEMDEISIDRINKVLIWYEDNIGCQFTPIVEGGSSLRQKFSKLEAAIERDKRPKTNGKQNGASFGSRRFGKKVDYSQTKYISNEEYFKREMAN